MFAHLKKIAILLTALSFSLSLMACDALVGTWKSDAEATMSFNRASAKLQERQDRFLATLMGKMTLTFTDKQVHLHMPDTNVTVKGELKPFTGFEERNPYKKLFCNKRMAVLETSEVITGDDSVTTYYFVGPNVMWVYLGANGRKAPDLHLRGYFKRLR